MRASRLEYRFRFLLHGLIFALGFTAPWRQYVPFDRFHSLWELAATKLGEQGLLRFEAAFVVVLLVAVAFLVAGAFCRVWGTAYVGAAVVASGSLHGDAIIADGPYRRTRNPLYLGTLLHTIGLSLLMPPSGALLAIALVWVLQFRLALTEESFLAQRFGERYLEYRRRVPRFLPSLKPEVPASGAQPHWISAIVGEFYFVALPLVLLIWGWQFNAQILKRGALITLGIWIIIYALQPRARDVAGDATA